MKLQTFASAPVRTHCNGHFPLRVYAMFQALNGATTTYRRLFISTTFSISVLCSVFVGPSDFGSQTSICEVQGIGTSHMAAGAGSFSAGTSSSLEPSDLRSKQAPPSSSSQFAQLVASCPVPIIYTIMAYAVIVIILTQNVSGNGNLSCGSRTGNPTDGCCH